MYYSYKQLVEVYSIHINNVNIYNINLSIWLEN